MNTITTAEIIQRARQVHSLRYDYSKVQYNGMHCKVLIICPVHGDFQQSPANHLQGQKCPKCTSIIHNAYRSATQFIKKASKIHNNKYDYSQTIYKDSNTKIEILCNETDHGTFTQTPSNHLSGHGCPKCGGSEKLSNTLFIEKANKKHNNKFCYNKTNYYNARSKVTITCPTHGDFLQTPNVHLSGCGCPKCKSGYGKTCIEQCLLKMNISFKTQIKFSDCKYKRTLPFDFGIYKNNDLVGLIEYRERRHYLPISLDKKGTATNQFKQLQCKDEIKENYCIKNNILFLKIPYWDFDRITEILAIFNTCSINKNPAI